MNHKRCGVGVKAPRLREIFSVTNPGPFFFLQLKQVKFCAWTLDFLK